jgi:glutamate-1-semialdehyde 2,1-aminomutase
MVQEPQLAESVDPAHLETLIEEQEAVLLARQPRSAALADRAVGSLAGGVTSNWQIARPQPVWLSHGEGSKVYDVDGHEYVDLHGGYGVNLAGHGHPRIVEATTARMSRGTHFAQPTEDAVVVAEDLRRRWGLPLWRFGNSGTEATMDAFHLMRAATGRDLVVKVEGCYHGHHDSALVSSWNTDVEELGPPDRPRSVASGAGLPQAVVDLTRVVPFNDLEALRGVFEEDEGRIAGMILEPVMMNAGIIPPEDGYLQGVRDIVHAHGALLTFDEIKTGLTVGPSGATGRYGVKPDIVCLAKAIGGGLPCAAIGGTEQVMGMIANGQYEQVGTFNGNPLSMAASRAMLTEVMTDEAYRRVHALRSRIESGTEELIGRFELPAHVVTVGAKGCVTFSPTRIRNFRDFLTIDDRFSHCHWLFQHNGAVFMPPWGKAEQWLLSVQHTEGDVDRFLDNFETFARALRG